MTADGWRAGHVVAFARRWESDLVIAIVPRLAERLCARAARWPVGPDVWKDTRLRVPETWAGRWFRNALTGERLQPIVATGAGWLAIASALATYPVALLVAESSSRHE